MKKLLLLSLLAAGLLAFQDTNAATAGQLIKASSPSVYYLAQDGKRYTFPTEKTYLSWYSNFDGVQTISDTELASYALGGNVTYKPGTRLVKVTTDPKVYAIGQGGQLRWIQSESLATSLYGSNWATQIDDIPDAFFVNYKVGANISVAGDYSRSTEQANATSIQTEINAKATGTVIVPPVTPPTSTTTQPTTPTSTYTGVILAPDTAQIGQRFTINTGAEKSGSLAEIKISVNNTLLQTCNNAACAVEYQIPTSNSTSTYTINTSFRWITGETYLATKVVTLQPGISGVTLDIPRPEVRPGDQREVVVYLDPSVNAFNTTIILNGTIVKSCTQQRECRYSEGESNPIGTIYPVYAEITDQLGNVLRSETATISVVANAKPLVTVSPEKYLIYKGETLLVTVTAQDDDGIANTQIYLGDELLKQCASQSCSVQAGPWTESKQIQFTGKATDGTGLIGTRLSSKVTVQ